MSNICLLFMSSVQLEPILPSCLLPLLSSEEAESFLRFFDLRPANRSSCQRADPEKEHGILITLDIQTPGSI